MHGIEITIFLLTYLLTSLSGTVLLVFTVTMTMTFISHLRPATGE